MRLVAAAIVTIPLLCACGSNQPSGSGPDRSTSHSQNIQQDVESIPQKKTPVVPMDGRLRDEHMQMYVSVKIRQEQLRYEQGITYIAKQDPQNPHGKPAALHLAQARLSGREQVPDRVYEQMAVKEFEFNRQLFYWTKQTIRNVMDDLSNEGGVGKRTASNFEESVKMHNRNMIKKYRDELAFALNYQLPPSKPIEEQTASANPAVMERQTALFLDPSS